MHLEAACLAYGGLLEMVLGMGIVGQAWRGGMWGTARQEGGDIGCR